MIYVWKKSSVYVYISTEMIITKASNRELDEYKLERPCLVTSGIVCYMSPSLIV